MRKILLKTYCLKTEIYEEINLIIRNNFIKQKLALLIEKLKKDGTIGENPVKNIDRVNNICKLEIKNPDLKITCPIIKATPYEHEEFQKHIKELKDLKLITKT